MSELTPISSTKNAKPIRGRPFPPGVSGNPGGAPGRARQALNADTIREMHLAFTRGGRKAIDKVMKNNPAVFLKLLVLLVPREMTVEHKGGVKAMTDEQLEAGIEAIQQMLEARGESAKVVEGVEVIPPPPTTPKGRKPKRIARRKVRKSDEVVGEVDGKAGDRGDN